MIGALAQLLRRIGNVLRSSYRRRVQGGYLYELDFARYAGEHVPPDVEGSFAVIPLDVLPSLAPFVSPQQYRLFEARMRERRDLMIAFLSPDGVLINWAWLSAFPTYYEPIVDYHIEIPDGAVLMYDSQTLPRNLRAAHKARRSSARGEGGAAAPRKVGVYEASLTNSIQVARELGRRKAVAVVVDNNAVPVQMLKKLGFRKVKRLRFIRFFSFRYHGVTDCA